MTDRSGDGTLRTHTLSNGLTILGEPRNANQSAGIGFFVKTGARDEVGSESGVSHFLEHMMFKGTSKRTSLELTYHLGNIGAQANAYTSDENTVFYATILPEHFSSMQEILSDMLRPALDPEEFSTEKKVILEEIALYQDRPQFCLFEKANARYFDGHTSGHSVLGSISSITELKQEEMKRYFDKRYSPSNMVLVASGRFDWDRYVEDAEKYCGGWKTFVAGRETPRFRRKADSAEFTKSDLNQVHLLLLTEGCSAQEDERYPLSLLALILGDGSGSKLYWDLVETGIAEVAVADLDEKDGTGCFYAYAATEPDRIGMVSERIRSILSKPLDFSTDDLERAKTKLISRIVTSGELPMGRLMSIGNDWSYRGSVTPLKEVISRIKKVGRSDIEKALSLYPLSEWCEYRMIPE